jgi:hypothetical protein
MSVSSVEIMVVEDIVVLVVAYYGLWQLVWPSRSLPKNCVKIKKAPFEKSASGC